MVDSFSDWITNDFVEGQNLHKNTIISLKELEARELHANAYALMSIRTQIYHSDLDSIVYLGAAIQLCLQELTQSELEAAISDLHEDGDNVPDNEELINAIVSEFYKSS